MLKLEKECEFDQQFQILWGKKSWNSCNSFLFELETKTSTRHDTISSSPSYHYLLMWFHPLAYTLRLTNDCNPWKNVQYLKNGLWYYLQPW